ncbi:SLAM family member 6-like [Chanodichthys erythropterus]|uniref:SLAM family member 6-like n=1 Tax=Chanodichthys erythropterus TaxID=933992 RepID=UPI00351F7A2A
MIHQVFFSLCLWSLVGVFGVDALKSVSVKEGDSVTLNLIEKQTDEVIEWRFGHNNILIARINRQNNKGTFYDDSAGGRFRGRLKLDQTGSLSITNSRNTDSGLYKVTGSRTDTPISSFSLSVYAPLPIPVPTHFTQCPSSSKQNCSMVCSVLNVSHVTLSWHMGNSLFSSINLSLPPEVESQDKNTYRCVLTNPISHQTQSSAAIRLVHCVLVGVATVVALVYEFRSRSLQQKRREKTSPSKSVSDQSGPQEDEDVHEIL